MSGKFAVGSMVPEWLGVSVCNREECPRLPVKASAAMVTITVATATQGFQGTTIAAGYFLIGGPHLGGESPAA